MAIAITAQLLEPYFHKEKKHPGYEESSKLYEELRIHANGEYPKEIIDERRPSESDKIKEYRKKIYIKITKEPISNIITSLSKIRRSADWSVKFPDDQPASIPDDETLQGYISKKFPNQTTVGVSKSDNNTFEGWVFGILLKSYLIDANALILVRPINSTDDAGEYLKPYPYIYHSDQVIEQRSDLVILKTKAGRFIVVTEEVIETWEKNDKGNYVRIDEYRHMLGILPVVKTCGVFAKAEDEIIIYESRIQTVAQRLNEVAREYSDLQAEVVQHIHSEKWVFATQQCPDCSVDGVSTGRVIEKKTKKNIVCPKCNGSGSIATSPYTQMVIHAKDKRFSNQEIPIPPAGYIQKQVDIVKIQDERIDKHIYQALASINMQFLAETPLNESGYAKEVDRDELNNFVYSVAEDLVSIMDKLLYLFARYRYSLNSDGSSRSDEEVEKLLPDIAVPEKFDLLSSNFLVDEIAKAKTSKVNGVIVNALEVDFASKKFYNEPEVKNQLTAVLELDPLPALSEDEKMTRLQNGGVTQQDYIISSNIVPFVRRALFDKKEKFYDMTLDEKMKLMQQYAADIEKKISGQPEKENETDPDDPNPDPQGE